MHFATCIQLVTAKVLTELSGKYPHLTFFSDKEKCMCLWMFYFDEAANGCELPGGGGGGTVPVEEGLLLCDLEVRGGCDGWKHINGPGQRPKPGVPAWSTVCSGYKPEQTLGEDSRLRSITSSPASCS